MTLIVEDGTGRSDAESLISVADADTYFGSVGNTIWADFTTAQKEQALRKATIYMVGQYAGQWAGTKTNSAQALDWPRYMVPVRDAPSAYGSSISYYPYNTVPALVAKACAELAIRSSSDDLAADLSRGIKREKVVDLEVEYDTNSAQFTRYRQVDLMLKPFLKAGGGSSTVILTR